MGKANFTEDLERDAIPSDRRGELSGYGGGFVAGDQQIFAP